MKKCLRSWWIIILIQIVTGNLYAQKTFQIYKTETPPLIDGFVNDETWDHLSSIDTFLQREPMLGEPLSENTEVFVCFDSQFLYFGIKCYQPEETVFAKQMKFDESYYTDDRFAIILDTYSDHRTAYFIGINALGGREDAIIQGNSMNSSWNGLWKGKAQITSEGWEAEIALPFRSLSFDKKSDSWGLVMNRFITKKREWGSWPVANINASQFSIAETGMLKGLTGITHGMGIDFSPYFITGFDAKNGEKPEMKLNAGADLYYQIAPNLKAALSINTDFAETEADSRQINLTRFSLRLNEKRKFFLDGANYFSFGSGSSTAAPSGKIEPFFSRRIGLDPIGKPIPVNYGAKLTGKIGRFNVGLLNMSDDRDYGNTNFSVARMSYDIGKQSTVGLISTYGNTNDSIQNGVAGVDLKLATSTFKRDKNVSLDLFILKSVTDKLHGKNYSWGATFAYPNDLIDFQLGHVQIGKNFHTGIGYVSRTNIKETFGSLMIEPRLNSMGVRQLFFGGSFDYVTDFSHKPETRSFGFTPFSILFESGERFTYSLNRRYDHFDQDFNIFSHFIIPANEYKWWENQLSLFTEGSRKLSGRLSYGFGDFYTGQKNNLSVSANWKIAVPFMISSSITTNQIKLPDGKFNTHIFEFNLNWLFSPDITVYNSFQYDNLSEIAGWQSRFQWILSPGNEILFVWNSSFLKTLNSYSWDEAGLRFKVKYNIRL